MPMQACSNCSYVYNCIETNPYCPNCNTMNIPAEEHPTQAEFNDFVTAVRGFVDQLNAMIAAQLALQNSSITTFISLEGPGFTDPTLIPRFDDPYDPFAHLVPIRNMLEDIYGDYTIQQRIAAMNDIKAAIVGLTSTVPAITSYIGMMFGYDFGITGGFDLIIPILPDA